MRGVGTLFLDGLRGRVPLRGRLAHACAALSVIVTGGVAPATAQTINGRLLDLGTDQPINLGLVMMFTEDGDSIGSTITDAAGGFSLSSPEPGSFVLRAAALGYRETPAGVFELGRGASMTVEYRLPAEPLPIDEILVALDRPTLQHRLVRNGFVRRLQRGVGVFVTPHDIEESPQTTTEMLMAGVPGVTVGPVFGRRELPGGTMLIPRPDEHVRFRSTSGEWCYPTVYVDGVRAHYDIQAGLTMSQLVDRQSVEGIEIYRRPLEIPAEYAIGQGTCGVVLLWSKDGATGGQRVYESGAAGVATDGATSGSRSRSLPRVDVDGPPPEEGEPVRLELNEEARAETGLGSPWEGTFLEAREGELIGRDPTFGRAVAIPLDGVEALQVRRERGPIHALRRGAIAGGLFGTGMWLQLRILCRSGCEGVLGSAWFPATVTALVFGALFAAQGPGEHWVSAPLPPVQSAFGASGQLGLTRVDAGLDIGLRLPVGRGSRK